MAIIKSDPQDSHRIIYDNHIAKQVCDKPAFSCASPSHRPVVKFTNLAVPCSVGVQGTYLSFWVVDT